MKEFFIKQYRGFTLAEVLITLGIIGVVAAITIPTLMKNTQDNEFKTAWKKAYSQASQAYAMAVNENGGGYGDYGVICSSPGTCTGNAKFSALQAQLKVIKTCNGNTFGNCWATNGVSPDSSIGGGTVFKLAGQNNRLGFVTSDGMFWILYSDNYPVIAVDINGNKGPNQWGKDVFIFYINDTIITTLETNGTTLDSTRNSVNFLKD